MTRSEIASSLRAKHDVNLDDAASNDAGEDSSDQVVFHDCPRTFNNYLVRTQMRSIFRNLVFGLMVIVGMSSDSFSQQLNSPSQGRGRKELVKEITNSIGIKLVLIPAGEFMMGNGESVEELIKAFPQYSGNGIDIKDEYPLHRVRITKPFYFGTCEVTNGQFRQFVESTGYKTQAERNEDDDPKGSGGWGFNQTAQKIEGRNTQYNWQKPGFPVTDKMPVVNVTWNDVVAFCQWLSTKEGNTYRLPTEAEWEYAARAGASTRYVSGDDPESLAKIANIADADFSTKFPNYSLASTDRSLSSHDGQIFPAPVGSFPANKFGLHDVHGNIWEWTSDWYAEDYYAKSPANDPPGTASGDVRVRRGGAWHTVAPWARLSFRNYNTPQSRYPNLGFRLVLTAN